MSDSIEQTTIGDRKATVIYLKDDFEPGSADDHVMIKIIYDDGDIEFATRKAAAPDEPDE